ncbi:MAG: NAD-dependent epimerase/dehydratase family protein, partial [Vicingaceae bacterium]
MSTILITGGTGYLGAWVAKDLLEKGYTLRLALRYKSKTAKYDHLQKIADQSKGSLELWEADLLEQNSYHQAAEGANAIIHMASPFTLRFDNAEKELIQPALEGTRNVLTAANASSTVKKVVLTSSVAAIYGDNIDQKEQGLDVLDENHFNETSSVDHQPYSYSKVLAEKEAWKMAEAQNQWKLVVINPSFVIGPSLSKHSNSESLAFMQDMLSGKYRMGAPDLMFGYVDVRDVAKAHLLALERADAQGRHLLAERTASVLDLVELLKEKYGNQYKLPLMKAPKWLLL